MSDLVERLRNFRTRGAKYGDVFASYSPGICVDAARRIETLETACDIAKAGWDAAKERIKELDIAEQDALDINEKLLAENEHLRAALERIRDYEPIQGVLWGDEDINAMLLIAREALKNENSR